MGVTPWYLVVWNAVLNAPITVIGFIGVTIGWYFKARKDKKQRESDDKLSDETRSVEIANIIQEAHLALDRFALNHHDLMGHLKGLLKSVDVADIADLPDEGEIRDHILQAEVNVKNVENDLKEFDSNDHTHANLLTAIALLTRIKRFDNQANRVRDRAALLTDQN